MMTRAFNFSAGPAVLPERVLLEAQATLLALPASGFSPLEMSHRSPWFEEVIAEAEANLRGLLTIPANYRVLFLQGGASLQFSMVPMNLLRGSGSRAEYVVTGSWGTRAVKEAAIEGEVVTIWTGEASGFDRTPSPSELSPSGDAAYLHFTSNETIQGVEFPPSVQPEPDGQVPLVCDASSDLLSRPVEIGRYGLVYAGAQKNAGSAGLTIVIIREDLLERAPDDLPTMLAYRTHADAGSLYNTPPVFSVYILMLVTRWLRDDIGGLEKMAALNEEKAALVYQQIDGSAGFYRGHAEPDSRSRMNVTWRLQNEELERRFISEAAEAGLIELKGHRSVGGIRASIYNAMPREGVEALAEFMSDFASKS